MTQPSLSQKYSITTSEVGKKKVTSGIEDFVLIGSIPPPPSPRQQEWVGFTLLHREKKDQVTCKESGVNWNPGFGGGGGGEWSKISSPLCQKSVRRNFETVAKGEKYELAPAWRWNHGRLMDQAGFGGGWGGWGGTFLHPSFPPSGKVLKGQGSETLLICKY